MLMFLAIIHLIAGRDEVQDKTVVRRPLYRAQVEKDWVRQDPSPSESIEDTTKANVTYRIDDAITLTVHSFPSPSLEQRIPPRAQVARWQRQTGDAGTVTRVSRGGFSGLFYESSTTLAWSMQLDPYHYHHLSFLADNREEWEHYQQLRSDYTIKIVGPPEKIALHHEALVNFARSFRLIQELP